ncbi:MAG: enoyl-CoA hydratase [Alphaproteobacteria bacterium]
MSGGTIIRNDEGGVATLTLNRPQARNALSIGLMQDLRHDLEDIAGDPALKAIVIRGEGPAFCAGHDLKEMRANNDPDFIRRTFELCSQLMQTVVHQPQPVIAQVHGVATAAGCQLVASCDLAIAAETARFATPGVNIGLFCSTPQVALSRTVSRKHAMEMLLTGDMVSAAHAAEIGLINRAVADDTLGAEVDQLARQIASKSGKVVRFGKAAFQRQLGLDLSDAYAAMTEAMIENMGFKDADEGINAFLEKRPPDWKER